MLYWENAGNFTISGLLWCCNKSTHMPDYCDPMSYLQNFCGKLDFLTWFDLLCAHVCVSVLARVQWRNFTLTLILLQCPHYLLQCCFQTNRPMFNTVNKLACYFDNAMFSSLLWVEGYNQMLRGLLDSKVSKGKGWGNNDKLRQNLRENRAKNIRYYRGNCIFRPRENRFFPRNSGKCKSSIQYASMEKEENGVASSSFTISPSASSYITSRCTRTVSWYANTFSWCSCSTELNGVQYCLHKGQIWPFSSTK